MSRQHMRTSKAQVPEEDPLIYHHLEISVSKNAETYYGFVII